MEDLKEFFEGLFKYDEWPPRWQCGYWSDFHGWLYIISELMIWLAYFLIPLIIIKYFSRKKTSIRFHWVYILFATFILLCGATHFIDAVMFWIPMYRFNAFVRLITGVISLLTVYHLMRVLPDLFKQRTNIELEEEISRRVVLEQKLALANQGLQSFAYIASHDLQEPLRKITNFSTMLYRDNEDKFDERSKANALKVTTSAERLRTLIDDVLTLSTISDNIELHPVDTNMAVKQAIDDLELKIAEKEASISVDTLPLVKGNLSYLNQLFYNLVSNALKFNNKKPVITITGELSDEKAIITITDNGLGFHADNYKKIFEAFHRLHGKSEYEGTGIGLAICKKIVEVHQGEIEVTSEIDTGTTFTITLLKG